MLANAAYASSTVVRYDRAVAQFINYAQLGKFSVQSVHELDCALASYCAFLYDQGYAPAAGNSVVAGLQRHYHHVRGQLPQTAVRIRGWMHRMPVVKRHPLTWTLTRTIAYMCMRIGRVHMAVAYVVGFHCMLRISEIRGLCMDDIAPVGDARFDESNKSIVLRIKVAKTGVNQAVSITDPFVMRCFGLVIGGRSLKSPEPVFQFTEWDFRAGIRWASAVLGLAEHFTPHSLRHGGCTYLYTVEKLDPGRIMVRGRWTSQKSFTHYLQEHAAALVNLRISTVAELVGRVVHRCPVDVFKLALLDAPTAAPQVIAARRAWRNAFGL